MQYIPDCINNTAASNASSVLSNLSLDKPTANSNIGSTRRPSPSDLSCDLCRQTPLCIVMVSFSGSYRQAARRHMISMQQDFSNRIWSSTNNYKNN